MLESIDFSQKRSRKGEKKRYKELVKKLILLQQRAIKEGVGLVVLFEGWNGAGKGSRISDLLYNLDARATTVHITADTNEKELAKFAGRKNGVHDYFPVMQEFWQGLGPRGNITFYDRGWYARALERMRLGDPMETYARAISTFERQLVSDGYIVVKFFLHVSAEGQRDRLVKLRDDSVTKWRVSAEDLESISRYSEDYRMYDRLLENSSFDYAPWVVINGEDADFANLDVVETLVNELENRFARGEDPAAAAAAAKAAANSAGKLKNGGEEISAEEKLARAQAEADLASSQAPLRSRFATLSNYPRLEDVDYTLALDEAEYKKRLKKEQARLYRLEMEMFKRRIPMIIMYEGQDAAGKGGSIKRVAQALDARAYTIFPSPAPTKPELMHPFLWRYWTRLPKAGHVGIYDRSWYGRVLVERVEGFASPAEWSRAYDEINEFERSLVDWGAILLKFWVEIDADEQLARFKAREEDPQKQWKITEEDYRNRDKAPQYHAAISDMLRLTSTSYAPWHILESNNKLYARIKALEIINNALEARLDK